MKTRFYLYKNGELKRQDNSLVVIHSKNHKSYIPILQVDLINVFSNVSLNKSTLALLNDNAVIINFFSYYGKYLGSFLPKNPKYGKTLVHHFEHYNSLEKRFYIAKEMTYSSCLNGLSVLKYYNKKYSILKKEIVRIENIMDKIRNLNYTDSNLLSIYEANVKRVYYSCFDTIIRNKNFTFISRSKNPPLNPVNAMMSYGYSILYSIIESIIYRSSLEISLPFVHSANRRRGGLQFDIADIFKPIIMDRTIFRLVNKNQIQLDYFEKYKDGTYLNKTGVKFFIDQIETFLQSTLTIYGLKNKLSYNQLLSREVHKLSNHIKNIEKYTGFKMKW